MDDALRAARACRANHAPERTTFMAATDTPGGCRELHDLWDEPASTLAAPHTTTARSQTSPRRTATVPHCCADERRTARGPRRCLQSLWKISIVGAEPAELLADGLARRFAECGAEKNGTLTRFDIVQSLRKTYKETPRAKIAAALRAPADRDRRRRQVPQEVRGVVAEAARDLAFVSARSRSGSPVRPTIGRMVRSIANSRPRQARRAPSVRAVGRGEPHTGVLPTMADSPDPTLPAAGCRVRSRSAGRRVGVGTTNAGRGRARGSARARGDIQQGVQKTSWAVVVLGTSQRWDGVRVSRRCRQVLSARRGMVDGKTPTHVIPDACITCRST